MYKVRDTVVIDTSALLAVLLNEPARPALIRATTGCELVAAPSLPWEVGNALVAGFRRRRLSVHAVHEAWSNFAAIPVRLAEIDVDRALGIAISLGLYAYDGYVLEASRAERQPLLTLDAALERAAHRIHLPVLKWQI